MKKILYSVLLSITFTTVSSQPGSIDSSFGINGFVADNYPASIQAIEKQKDNKLLVAGSFLELNALIARFLPDGILDSTFGINGGAISNPPGHAYDMILLADGRILTAGEFADENDHSQSFLARFTPEGKADSSFGINGTCILPQISGFASYEHIVVNEDGSIIAGGSWFSNDNLDTQCTILSRLSANGVFDYSFGNGGRVFNLAAIRLKALALQPDGKIVVAGYNFAGGFQQQDFVFSRYNPDASLDNSFGNNGNIVMDGMGGEDVPYKIIIQPDGKIVIGGASGSDTYYMSALRMNNNGSLDNTFGKGGKVFIRTADQAMQAFNMLQQQDGKFVLTGGAYDYISTNLSGFKFGLCRTSNNGVLDSSFGINGVQITPYKSGNEAYASCLQSDGKIVLGGYYYQNGFQRYLIARYNNDDLTKKQILIAKIRRWLQHHNGIVWDNMPGVKSYAVQRSGDGVRWTTVHSQQSIVNSQSSVVNSQLSTVNYYNDASPLLGTNYYRLQTTSLSGALVNSNVIAVTSDALNVSLSPNPAKNILSIAGLPANEKVKLTVVDFSGNVKLQGVANVSSYNLNIASLHAGNYVIKMDINGEVISKQFVKE